MGHPRVAYQLLPFLRHGGVYLHDARRHGTDASWKQQVLNDFDANASPAERTWYRAGRHRTDAVVHRRDIGP